MAGASSTCSSLLSTRRSSLRSTSDSARGWGAGTRSGFGGGGLWRCRRYQRAWASPTAAHPARTPTSGVELGDGLVDHFVSPRSVGALSVASSLQQRRELSLHLDHLAGAVQLGGQTLVLAAQPGHLAVTGIGRLASGRLGQRLQRAAVALLAPLRDQRRVQALAAQQRALARLVQALVLVEDLRLVLRRVPPRAAGPLGDLGVRIS